MSSDIMHVCLHDSEKTTNSEKVDVLTPLQSSERNYAPHSAYEKLTDMATLEGPEFRSDETFLLPTISNMINVEHQEFEEMRHLNERRCRGDSSGCKNMSLESENATSVLNNSVINNTSFNALIHSSEKVSADSACFPSVFLDTVVCESDKLLCVDAGHNEMLSFTALSDVNSQKHTKKSECQTEPCDKDTSYFQPEPCCKDTSYMMSKFPAGCELHEALGPAFLKGSKCFDWLAQVNQDMKTVDMPDEISTSQLTSESRPEHLLEAMVANISHSNNDNNGELSFCTSMQSAMTSGKNPEASLHNVHSVNSKAYSIDHPSLLREDKHHSLSSSTCPGSYSEQFERSSEPSKNSKKRARPGESCRPRPRDRQLIQDRIKDLRELVPNGAKVSCCNVSTFRLWVLSDGYGCGSRG